MVGGGDGGCRCGTTIGSGSDMVDAANIPEAGITWNEL